jgi:hypothetical protein
MPADTPTYSLSTSEQQIVVRALFTYMDHLSNTLDVTSPPPGWKRRAELEAEVARAHALINRIEDNQNAERF